MRWRLCKSPCVPLIPCSRQIVTAQTRWHQHLLALLGDDALDYTRIGDHTVAGLPPEPGPLFPAAVLVGLVERPFGITLLLTQRTDHLLHHPGQISFPGGACEAHDATPVETALREAEEEIGLDRRLVEIVGRLPCYQTITGFLITPIVGYIAQPPHLNPHPYEVAEVFELPLAFVLDSANHQLRSCEIKGVCRHYYVLPYQNYFIWGATAAILVELARRLRPLDSDPESWFSSSA